ncbi:MAG TPA: glycine cleavage system protein T, partial [Alcanivorax sp.]|nr:glycine cleavage system protein T [Alcanivorax sp.]
GLNLYGNDMDEDITPWEAGLGWTVALDDADRDFVGRAALEKQKSEGHRQLLGLVLEGKGVLRAHQGVHVPGGSVGPDGEITSGTFSPTLGKAVALARLPAGTTGTVEVAIRNKRLNAQVVRAPFVRNGKATYKPL